MSSQDLGPNTRIGYCTATSGYSEKELDRREALVGALLPQGYSVEIVDIPNGPEFLDRAEDFEGAIAAAAAWAQHLPADRFDVVVSAGALDPGLTALRRVSPVPVVGPGAASLAVAATYGAPVSIVTVDPLAVSKAKQFLAETWIKTPVASIRCIGIPVRQIVKDFETARQALRSECALAVERDGAGVIMLGAMTLGTLNMDRQLKQDLSVPVVNPVVAAIQQAITCLRSLP